MSQEDVLGTIADGLLGVIDEMKAENVALKAEVASLRNVQQLKSAIALCRRAADKIVTDKHYREECEAVFLLLEENSATADI